MKMYGTVLRCNVVFLNTSTAGNFIWATLHWEWEVLTVLIILLCAFASILSNVPPTLLIYYTYYTVY